MYGTHTTVVLAVTTFLVIGALLPWFLIWRAGR